MLATLIVASLGHQISLPSLAGKPVQIFPSKATKGVVTFFVLCGCPNANAYVPEMNRIAAKYGPLGWKFYLDYVDSSYSLPELVTHSKEFGYQFPVVRGQGLIALAKATKSPEAAVFTPDGTLLYHGRIDDRFYALGKQRSFARTHDLRDALEAATSGKKVAHPSTEVIGCYIPLN